MSGTDEKNHYGVYGLKGVPKSSNMPSGRAFAVSCIDKFGDIWLFGGEGYASPGKRGKQSI
jgi:hypothetical protein